MTDLSKMGETGCGNGRKVFPTLFGVGNRLSDQPLSFVKKSLQILDDLRDMDISNQQNIA